MLRTYMSKQTIIYARWSSQEQIDGTTLERQIRNCTNFAVERNLGNCQIVTDEGVSAYSGANIRTGNLSKLVKDFIYARRDPKNTIILVEELDRLTRADAMTAFAWINQVLNMGVTIMVQTSGKTLDAQLLRDDISALMGLVMENFNSNFESKKKARRIAAYWDIARKKGDVNPNLRHPSWLKVDDDKLVALEGAKELIDSMFDMALNGQGSTSIAKALNEARIEPFAATKRRPLYWTPAKVRRIIYNDATLGYYTPFTRPRDGDAHRAGAKILRYPPMVSQDKFDAVKRAKKESKGGRSNTVTNLIPRISRCYHCKGAMGARGSASKGHYYIYCMTAKSGSGKCNHMQGWRYADIEKPLLDHLLNRAISDDAFADTDDSAALLLSMRLSELNATIHAKTDHLKFLLKKITGDHEEIVMEVYDDVSSDLSNAKAEAEKIRSLLDMRQGKVSPEVHIERVRAIRDQLEHAEPDTRNKARRIARDALANLIDLIEFDNDTENAVVHLAGGMGTFLILDGHGSLIMHHHTKDFTDHPKRDAIERFLRST